MQVITSNTKIEIDCTEKLKKESLSGDNSYQAVLIIANNKISKIEKYAHVMASLTITLCGVLIVLGL